MGGVGAGVGVGRVWGEAAEGVAGLGVRLGFVSTKASRQSTLGYAHGSSLSVDTAQATNLMVTQDTGKVFIQVRPPCGRNTYVLRLIVLLWIVLR